MAEIIIIRRLDRSAGRLEELPTLDTTTLLTTPVNTINNRMEIRIGKNFTRFNPSLLLVKPMMMMMMMTMINVKLL